MQFIHASIAKGIADLRTNLTEKLQNKERVLWLLSGGSNIPLSVQIIKDIPKHLTSRLTIMPADERYGTLNHTDSNVYQLYKAGFTPKNAKFIPVLTGESFISTQHHFSNEARRLFASNDYIIAQLGMGADGHIAGILPNSAATSIENDMVVGYTGHDFQRLTLTFSALKQINAAYLFAYGENKHEALMHLQKENISCVHQPVQILKAIPSAYVYNDQLEGE